MDTLVGATLVAVTAVMAADAVVVHHLVAASLATTPSSRCMRPTLAHIKFMQQTGQEWTLLVLVPPLFPSTHKILISIHRFTLERHFY
jgi:hypothetical protein